MPVIQNQAVRTLDKIVVATDFTPESENALGYAGVFAHQFGSRLMLAHIIDLSVTSRYPNAVVGLPLDQMRHDSAENLERALFDLRTLGVRAKGKIIEAHNPAEAIVEFSEEVDADLVIVGTHNRQGLSRLILGSCSEEVIHTARCPVLTISPEAKPHPVHVAFRSVVFATDLKHDAVEKAAAALAFAKDSITNVHICHIVEDQVESFADAFNLKTGAKGALSELIPNAGYSWSDIKPSILWGNIEQEILMVAKKTKADLIVLGAHRGARRSKHFWDKIVESVIRTANCPVLTVFPCQL